MGMGEDVSCFKHDYVPMQEPCTQMHGVICTLAMSGCCSSAVLTLVGSSRTNFMSSSSSSADRSSADSEGIVTAVSVALDHTNTNFLAKVLRHVPVVDTQCQRWSGKAPRVLLTLVASAGVLVSCFGTARFVVQE